MKCPRCSRDLQTVSVSGVAVDICQDGCGGIWFDLFELEKMDQPEEAGDWLLQNMRIDLAVAPDLAATIECPRCAGITLLQQRRSGIPKTVIDKCPVCGGVWLDFGELFGIRAGKPASEETRAGTVVLLGALLAES